MTYTNPSKKTSVTRTREQKKKVTVDMVRKTRMSQILKDLEATAKRLDLLSQMYGGLYPCSSCAAPEGRLRQWVQKQSQCRFARGDEVISSNFFYFLSGI